MATQLEVTIQCTCKNCYLSIFHYFTVPTPVVLSSVNTTGRIFESTNVSLLCNVTVAPLDVESVVNITWFGPNGMITADNTRYNFNADRSLLTFTTALIDNGPRYYCTASYGANVTVPRSSLIYLSSDTSDNTTVNVESKLCYMHVDLQCSYLL